MECASDKWKARRRHFSGCLEETGGEATYPEKERTIQEREREAMGNGGGLSKQGSSGEGVQVDQVTGEGTGGGVSQHGEERQGEGQ